MLEEMRRKMLFRRDRTLDGEVAPTKEQQQHDAESMRSALFEGRAVTVQRLEQPLVSNPAITDDATDPHKLFQLLRRKKRAAPHHLHNGNSPLKASVPKAQLPPPPQPPPPPPPPLATCGVDATSSSSSGGGGGDRVAAAVSGVRLASSGVSGVWWGPPSGEREHTQSRHVNSARPAAAKRPTSSLRDRSDVHSASSATTYDGRPVTRQKHPKMALDLFPTPTAKATAGHPPPAERFPPKPGARRTSTGLALHVPSANAKSTTKADRLSPQQQQHDDDAPNARVDFSCLFFHSDDDLDAHEEFPAARAQVEIPLIETDWFMSDNFERLPTTDGVDQLRDDELDGPADSPRYAESLYEMLVAQKRPRKASAPCL